MRRSNNRTPYVFHAAMILLCLVLISSHLTGGMYARYVATSSGSDGARVAKYGVRVSELSSLSFNLNTFDQNALSATGSFTVESDGEVAVEYDVILTFPEAVPSWMTLTLDGNSPSVSGNVYTFGSIGEFIPGGENSATHTLSVTVAPGLQASDISLTGVTVSVVATQID